MHITVDTIINAPKSIVWQAITDIDNSAEMISGIVSLDVLHRPENGLIGLKWCETREIFGKKSNETMWITHSEAHKCYQTRAENHGAIYITTLSVSEVTQGTRLTMTFSGTSESFFVRCVSAFMGFFIKKSMITMLNKDLADIKAFVEKSA